MVVEKRQAPALLTYKGVPDDLHLENLIQYEIGTAVFRYLNNSG